ncbi:hypothetical protein CDAR_409871 [Caerostris darwini]|uniref:Uncharacterized protein n=1 Tax=Caerostris darwini TaxID=1538125 RepID=A0AAV4SG93_9ARAC|nr:hypothetical protein CDAR_409871 [Caerostris darwini]
MLNIRHRNNLEGRSDKILITAEAIIAGVPFSQQQRTPLKTLANDVYLQNASSVLEAKFRSSKVLNQSEEAAICFGFPVQAFHYGLLRNGCLNEKNLRGFLDLRGPGEELRQQTKEVCRTLVNAFKRKGAMKKTTPLPRSVSVSPFKRSTMGCSGTDVQMRRTLEGSLI